MKKFKIFIACDKSNPKWIRKIISNTKTDKVNIGYKFGLEFFYSKNGRKFISKLKKKEIFLDLKLNDIPNTCVSAINSLKDLKNISYITAHINGGYEMLVAIKKASKKFNKNLKVLGVTVLTSISSSSIKRIGYTRQIKDIVKKQASLAKSAKLDGIICSGYEAKFIKCFTRQAATNATTNQVFCAHTLNLIMVASSVFIPLIFLSRNTPSSSLSTTGTS